MVSPSAFRRIFWLLDLFILGAAFLLTYALIPRLGPIFSAGSPLYAAWLRPLAIPVNWSGKLPPIGELAWILLSMAPVTLVMLGTFGNHDLLLSQSRTRILLGGFTAPFIGISVSLFALYVLKIANWSRLFTILFAGFSGIGLSAYRLGLRRYFSIRHDSGRYTINLALIGSSSGVVWLARYLNKNYPRFNYKLFGYLRLCEGETPTKFDGSALPLLGEVEQIGELLVNQPIHEVLVVYPSSGGDWLNEVIHQCDYFRVALHIVPEGLLMGEAHDLQTIYRSEFLQLPSITLRPTHWNSEALFLKRMIDIVISAILLILLSPLFAIVALLIKITTPTLPVFYRWIVVGKNGEEFTGYKFTTMYADADERKEELSSLNEMSGPVFKIKDDPRVTPLGRFLRKFSINELPQLWSVLKGDMSLVGPRPAFRHELKRYELWHKRKLSVRPGITCLWQVRGRNKINDFDNWVKMDLEYIDNWSLWLDFKILFWTAWAVFSGSGW
jgi:exopolysaccharide biosynthesis polyprenyl glycosylphosphotransferase